MTIAEAKQIAQDALAKGRLRLSPRGLLPATAARLLLSALHGKVRKAARLQLERETQLEKGLTARGTPRKPRNWKHPQLPARTSPAGIRAYARELMRLKRGSVRRYKINSRNL